MRDWENLRYFLAVARKGTVSAAAKELYVSHSTVLRRIEQFEKSLDSKLFKKLQRGYELTLAGEKLYNASQSVEANIEQLFSQAQGQHDVAAGKLRISQPESGILNTYPLYTQFQRQHPEITLEIYSTMTTHNINQQEVDIVMRIAQTPPELLVGRKLGVIKGRIYGSKKYLQTLAKNPSIEDYQWIVWRPLITNPNSAWLDENINASRIVLYAESMSDVISAVVCGMGVGFLSSHEAAQHPDLVELLEGEVIAENDLWILTHRDLRNSQRVKTFMRFMAENLILE